MSQVEEAVSDRDPKRPAKKLSLTVCPMVVGQKRSRLVSQVSNYLARYVSGEATRVACGKQAMAGPVNTAVTAELVTHTIWLYRMCDFSYNPGAWSKKKRADFPALCVVKHIKFWSIFTSRPKLSAVTSFQTGSQLFRHGYKDA